VKKSLFPDLYDTTGLRLIRSIEQFDDRYIAPAFGFAGARDYYAKASARRFLTRIRVPTLIIHAHDDPFIPISPLQEELREPHPHILLMTPTQGGHVAFISANSQDEDRFWAENRLVEFCELTMGGEPTLQR
jgi:predicted alpha/beta-fold hydrolase